MAAPPRAQDVLDFLTAHGFATAAAALEDDLNYLDSRPPHLPPVRIPPPSHHDTMEPSTCSSSVASDVFLSMNSSPSETLDPCGLWYKSDYSSDESDFGTARECKGFNVFSNCCSEDKFVMSLDEKAGQGEDYRCLFPLCECCSGDGNSNSAVYGRYRIMPDETETLDECGEDMCQLKRVDGIHDLNQEREIKMLQLRIAEKEFLIVNEHAVEGSTLANGHPPCDSKASEGMFMANRGKKELLKEDWNLQLVSEKASQPDANDDHEPGRQDTGAVGLEGEDHGATDELQLHNSFEDEYEIFHLRIIHRKNRTGFEESKDLPIIMNSVIAGRYYVTEYLGSAAFSKVVQARDLHTGIDVCLKIIKNDKDFFDQSLDEIKLLKFVNKYDPSDECHILRLYDYFYHQEHLFIVCELLRDNLYEFQKYNQESGEEVYFTLSRIQSIARQCLEALEYLHHLGIIHCDLKPENILIKSYSRCEIKLIDLGSSCFQTDNLCLYVQSRSYRAPEVILYLPYDQKIDMWSLGCVLAELYIGEVLFPNDSLVMILARMIGILGPIDMEMLEMGQETHKYFTDDYDLYHKNEETDQVEYLIPEKSSLAHHLQASDAAFLDFLNSLLQINPKRRPTASQALRHHWLSSSYQ